MEVSLENEIVEHDGKREYTGNVTITLHGNINLDAALREFLDRHIAEAISRHHKRNS